MKLLKIILVAFIVFNTVPSFSAEWVAVTTTETELIVHLQEVGKSH
jgi:hypothetical protein